MKFGTTGLLLASLLVAAPALAHEKGTGGIESLDVYQEGPVISLLVGEKKGKDRSFTYLRSNDGAKTWEKPVRIKKTKFMGEIGAFARGSDAQVATSMDRVVVVYTGVGSKWGTGPLHSAVSFSRGKDWSEGPKPSDGAAPEGQSYIDLVADKVDHFHAVWLDGRDGKQGLRYAMSTEPFKGWGPTETLMKDTCECCWNEIHAPMAGGVEILYREKDPRDMAIMRGEQDITGGWKKVGTRRIESWKRQGVVGAFGWKFDGCPHVGGALASAGKVAGEPLHALVWTGMNGKAGLYHLRSEKDVWSEPVRVGDESAKHADLAVNGERVAAVWDAVVDGKKVVLASTTVDGGKTWAAPKTLSQPGEHATHPRVVQADGGFAAFWTASAKGKPAELRQSRF